MFGLGATELIIILVIVIVLFGARRLPEIGSGVGKAIKNFRAGMSTDSEIDVTPANEADSTQAKSPDELADGRATDPAAQAKAERQKTEPSAGS
jgi:sec-independent protein translocase protein TatA